MLSCIHCIQFNCCRELRENLARNKESWVAMSSWLQILDSHTYLQAKAVSKLGFAHR